MDWNDEDEIPTPAELGRMAVAALGFYELYQAASPEDKLAIGRDHIDFLLYVVRCAAVLHAGTREPADAR